MQGPSIAQRFPVVLGTMNLAGEGRPSREVALATIHAALDAGVGSIDTADVYGLGEHDAHFAERLVAEVRRERAFVVSTKGGVRRRGEAWEHVGDPAYLRGACEASLGALGVDAHDLYFLHAVDPRVPIEESVGELVRLRDDGRIVRLGVSNVDATQLRRALAVAPIEVVQNEASPFVRLDPEVEATCRARGIVLQVYAPMGGWRAGRVAHEPVLRCVAEELGVSPFEAIVAWTIARGWQPVCGASRPENARSSARAAAIALTDAQVAAIDAIVPRA
ncbi:MAG: aldo/keto reductase [Myxococcota bacterium]|jgi:aryl-alcohol dehydrogenase-like predicted oxidoreductase|nr:aldo/keto reductase [Myxococcota bacterium]